MTAATGVSRQAQEYLAAVEHELADLPAEDRSALLEDLALHLDALTAEDDDRPLHVRLGSPAAYAADLRAAAGLPPRPGDPTSGPAGLRERLAGVPVAPAVREVRRLLGELRPAWWVLRGYLVVLVPCLVERDGVPDVPVPAPLDSHALGVVLVVAAVVASVALGRRTLPRPVGVLVGAAGVALVLAACRHRGGRLVQRDRPRADGSGSGGRRRRVPAAVAERAVTDVLPYAADGTPLEGVLLYDQDGRPLHVGFQEWWADNCARVLEQPLAADDVPVPNSYPQSYVLDPAGVDLSRSIPRPADSCRRTCRGPTSRCRPSPPSRPPLPPAADRVGAVTRGLCT